MMKHQMGGETFEVALEILIVSNRVFFIFFISDTKELKQGIL